MRPVILRGSHWLYKVSLNFSKQSAYSENVPFQSKPWENNQFLQLCPIIKENRFLINACKQIHCHELKIFAVSKFWRSQADTEKSFKFCLQEYTLLLMDINSSEEKSFPDSEK
uniref:Testis cDNA clone: QtsA-12412, similar to human SET and MYND domain containing 4 (SMYD4) n=1 Tax=Macaca fascicularis TaxID=9541 RepID=Q4R8I6_MACFA|nr:unnamed protein product [Macaca fascicularis]